MSLTHVDGRNAGEVTLYALSTCVWCRQTKNLLDQLGVAYDYEYVDLLNGDDRIRTLEAVRNLNPSMSFPTMVIGGKCIVGFRENEIREALKQ